MEQKQCHKSMKCDDLGDSLFFLNEMREDKG